MNLKSYTRGLFLASGLILSPCAAQAQNLVDGLLNYWSFEDNAEDTASDFAGSAGTTDNDGTITGDVIFVAGQTGFGQAGSFPGGAGNRIVVPDPTGPDTNDIDRSGADLTISLWTQLTNRNTGWQALIAHGENSDYRVAVNRSNNPVQLAYAGGGGDIISGNTIGPGPAGDGLWHHVVVITEGTETRLYLDGELEATGTADGIAPSDNPQDALHIGGNPEVAGREWNGLIDDMGMWNRALTEDEITTIFIAGTSLSALLDVDDNDGDGLPNAWEIQFGLDPDDNGSIDVNNGPDGDPDGDDLSNLEEFNRQTFPNDEDSDDDTLFDNVETNTGIWILSLIHI